MSMSDQIKRDQEVIALRQRVTEMYANDPAKLNAFTANPDLFDAAIRDLPSGSSPYDVTNHLATQKWFRDAKAAEEEVPFDGWSHAIQPSDERTAADIDMPMGGRRTETIYTNKRYVGHIIQDTPGGDLLTLDWLLGTASNDIVRWLQGWAVTQQIGPHPIEPRARCFVAEKPVSPGCGSVSLYFSAIDQGIRLDAKGRRLHTTEIDANFVDSAKSWSVLAAERIVAETLDLLYHTFNDLNTGPDRPFWYRVSGTWACGSSLFQCPDWVRY